MRINISIAITAATLGALFFHLVGAPAAAGSCGMLIGICTLWLLMTLRRKV